MFSEQGDPSLTQQTTCLRTLAKFWKRQVLGDDRPVHYDDTVENVVKINRMRENTTILVRWREMCFKNGWRP